MKCAYAEAAKSPHWPWGDECTDCAHGPGHGRGRAMVPDFLPTHHPGQQWGWEWNCADRRPLKESRHEHE